MLGCLSLFTLSLSNAQTDIGKLLSAKMDQAEHALDKQETRKAWEKTLEIAAMIKQYPDYDDGEYAEGINDIVTRLLMKPWNDASPYLIGTKSTPAFRDFVVDHINELSSPHDLKIIKKNINQHCDPTKYAICEQLIIHINKSIHS